MVAWAVACGKQGPPQPPLKKTPGAVTNVRVAQRGARIEVSYVAPHATTDNLRLPVLDVELYAAGADGDFEKVARQQSRKAAPGEALTELVEPLPAPGTRMRFALRARARGEVSALTPVVAITIQEPPPAPVGLAAESVPEGVQLAWTDPRSSHAPEVNPEKPQAAATPTPASSPAPPAIPPPSYWVYRRPRDGTYDRPLHANPVVTATYRDATARPGETVCFVVRSVASTDPPIESEQSPETCLTVRDLAAPAPPAGLVLLIRAGAVELSWSPSASSDVAYYRIYRAIIDKEPERLAEARKETTSFCDGQPPHDVVLFYTVRAVDAAGNESPASAPAEGSVH